MQVESTSTVSWEDLPLTFHSQLLNAYYDEVKENIPQLVKDVATTGNERQVLEDLMARAASSLAKQVQYKITVQTTKELVV